MSINVRQPLSKIFLPVLDHAFQAKIEQVKDLILSETNIKQIEYISDTSGIIRKKIKPNFKTLGPKVGKDMKLVADTIAELDQHQIIQFEKEGQLAIVGTSHVVELKDVEVIAEDVPGWLVANLGRLTVALDITLTEELKQEGIARELVNRIQNLRKELNLEVTDKIDVRAQHHPYIAEAVRNNLPYICTEVLADSFDFEHDINQPVVGEMIEINDNQLIISIKKS